MLRSVVLVVRAACLPRVIARARTLPLAPDATVTIVELFDRAGWNRSPLELYALALLEPNRTLQCGSIAALDREALVEIIRTCRADLVVVGDAYEDLRGILGTTPVLVVKRWRSRYERPVVAIDSHDAEPVLQATQKLLVTRRPVMTAIHFSANVLQHAHAFLARTFASLGAFGVGWTRYLGTGDPKAAIVRVAQQSGADLVVIRSAFAKRGLIRELTCDVLTVPVGVTT